MLNVKQTNKKATMCFSHLPSLNFSISGIGSKRETLNHHFDLSNSIYSYISDSFFSWFLCSKNIDPCLVLPGVPERPDPQGWMKSPWTFRPEGIYITENLLELLRLELSCSHISFRFFCSLDFMLPFLGQNIGFTLFYNSSYGA